ncbi:ABC transporter permease [Mesorhizobium sp. M4B.F.Ca.ET.190.01.1.1]|uniref:ABC transporter permease n=1 Tax=unclassified Mesorhizobium TaxID=325217 RepID=UPI000A07DA98|nr:MULTISPECIES: ABC transporter permease [Mesorhizobium]RUW86382.1 ABC transporter permease [Mesorhizobium sp. M1E.F.Ca.ET.063.01.1.1]RWP03382.1 MAG: ABC transporter permease [Mesorhizobium sp.]TGR05643.1 ABC transporter permease [Mesorhizobium sp. M4B.F.Ca.ET.200.01.1.1]TGS16275.1 ABC transporter permease [Mesorhizobium sp. M4B.F.Ca.ET.190.01.1.1]TGT28476.1 ABC transporter permease [Mesorhizobium sp. M4B.F.Ca.ET.172.01.1.1]
MTELLRDNEPKEVAEALVSQTRTIDPIAGVDPVLLAAPPRNQWWNVWDQFKAHKGALAGAAVFSLIVVGVVFGPFVWRVSPTYIDFTTLNAGPSWAHPLGTDQLGRDLLARTMIGGRISIAVGLTAMVISIFLGTCVGVVAGYFKSLDGPLMRLTDLFLSLPVLPLLLITVMLFRDAVANILGFEMGNFILIVSAIGSTSWMQTARIVRGEVLAVKRRDFVLASRSIGAPPCRIIRRHVLPNVMSPIIVSSTLQIADAVISESLLSFLGLGFPPDFPTWGRLLFDGIEYIQGYPQLVLWPGIAISLTVLSVAYIGDGLRDALDPRLRR